MAPGGLRKTADQLPSSFPNVAGLEPLDDRNPDARLGSRFPDAQTLLAQPADFSLYLSRNARPAANTALSPGTS
jgi:hypothetical protein